MELRHYSSVIAFYLRPGPSFGRNATPAGRIDNVAGPFQIKANDRQPMRQGLKNNLSTGITKIWEQKKSWLR